MDLSTPLMYVKGVGPARAAMLEAKGLKMVEDLLVYAPFRYEDRSNVKTVARSRAGRNGHGAGRGALDESFRDFKRRNLGIVRSHVHRRIARDADWEVVSRRRILRMFFAGA